MTQRGKDTLSFCVERDGQHVNSTARRIVGLFKPERLRSKGLRQPHLLPTTDYPRTHRTIWIRPSGLPLKKDDGGKRSNPLGEKVSPPTHPPRPRIRSSHYSGCYRSEGGTRLQVFVERGPIN